MHAEPLELTAEHWPTSWRVACGRFGSPLRSFWTWMPPTIRSMATRKDGSFTATTATTATCRCTSSRENICCAPGSGVPTLTGPTELERIVGQIRQVWPTVSIIIRSDSGFCKDELLAWCESHPVDYVIGLAKNSRLSFQRAAMRFEMMAYRSDRRGATPTSPLALRGRYFIGWLPARKFPSWPGTIQFHF